MARAPHLIRKISGRLWSKTKFDEKSAGVIRSNYFVLVQGKGMAWPGSDVACFGMAAGRRVGAVRTARVTTASVRDELS